MAKLSNMEIGKTLLKDNRVTLKSSLFGLSKSAIYTPTGSPIKAVSYEYAVNDANHIEKLLDCKPEELEAQIKAIGTVKSDNIGNSRLEACLSSDHQFAALQLFRYSDFHPTAVTDLKIYEGKEAELVAQLF